MGVKPGSCINGSSMYPKDEGGLDLDLLVILLKSFGVAYIYRLYESVFGIAIRMFLKFHKVHSLLPNLWNVVKLWKHTSNWPLYNCTRPRAITYTNYWAFRLHTVQRFPHENVPKLWPNFCDILYTLIPASLVLKGNRRQRGRASRRISLERSSRFRIWTSRVVGWLVKTC